MLKLWEVFFQKDHPWARGEAIYIQNYNGVETSDVGMYGIEYAGISAVRVGLWDVGCGMVWVRGVVRCGGILQCGWDRNMLCWSSFCFSQTIRNTI